MTAERGLSAAEGRTTQSIAFEPYDALLSWRPTCSTARFRGVAQLDFAFSLRFRRLCG